MTQIMIDTLPCPRFEFRWRKVEVQTHNYECDYSLVIPLKPYDVRGQDGDEPMSEPSELPLLINRTLSTTAAPNWPVTQDGVVAEPYRDSCHAQWDCVALGGHIPIVAIYGDKATLVPLSPNAR